MVSGFSDLLCSKCAARSVSLPNKTMIYLTSVGLLPSVPFIHTLCIDRFLYTVIFTSTIIYIPFDLSFPHHFFLIIALASPLPKLIFIILLILGDLFLFLLFIDCCFVCSLILHLHEQMCIYPEKSPIYPKCPQST